MRKKIVLLLISILFFTSTYSSATTFFFEESESVEVNKDIKNDGVILFLAFPTEFYEYETNYTFFCPGRGFGIWITSEGIEYREICGAILDKDKFYGIANPIIVLGIKVRDI